MTQLTQEAAADDLPVADGSAPLAAAFGEARAIDRARAFYELTKPNLSGLVVVTGVLGLALASPQMDWSRLLHLVIGLWCTAGGAGALNMVIERNLDRMMRRTRGRPLPSGRVSTAEGLVFSIVLFALGFAELALFTSLATALLAVATLVLYGFVYTPLKRRGMLAVWIGAIPGAIPPVMGWAAYDGRIAAPALVLFGVLFLWQFPHFLALAWIYREDYLRAGFDFLPRNDHHGQRTARAMIAGAALLIPVTLLLQPLGAAGWLYSVGALSAGVWFLARTLRTLREPSTEARSVFFASIIYLPVLLAFIVVDRLLVG